MTLVIVQYIRNTLFLAAKHKNPVVVTEVRDFCSDQGKQVNY